MIEHGYQEILIELKRTRKLKGKKNEHIGSKLAGIHKQEDKSFSHKTEETMKQ